MQQYKEPLGPLLSTVSANQNNAEFEGDSGMGAVRARHETPQHGLLRERRWPPVAGSDWYSNTDGEDGRKG